jgi:hypothetical protein
MSEAALDALAKRVAALETESACRGVIARYFEICDRLGPDTPFDELGSLFTREATWQGKGRYKEAFGGYAGREAIVAMIATYCASPPHFAMTGHFFSAEAIETAGDTATGKWMMLQCSTYADGTSDLRSAALSVGFAREEQRWRIARFESENIFSRRVDRWSDEATIPVPALPAGE